MHLLHKEITDQVIKAFYTVYNKLGYGFKERVYEKAIEIELNQLGLEVKRQQSIKVYYGRISVGTYYADLVINNKVIIELKAVSKLIEAHKAQLLNYLRASNLEVGLVLNFGLKPEISRKIFTNDKKHRNRV